jgi:hypothetical protein
MNRGCVACRVRLVDIVAIGVVAEAVVVPSEDAGHAGRGGDWMDDSRAVPIRVAHRIEGREREIGIHGWGHAGLVSVDRSDLVLLLYETGRGVVKRGPLRGAVSVCRGRGRPCEGGRRCVLHRRCGGCEVLGGSTGYLIGFGGWCTGV